MTEVLCLICHGEGTEGGLSASWLLRCSPVLLKAPFKPDGAFRLDFGLPLPSPTRCITSRLQDTARVLVLGGQHILLWAPQLPRAAHLFHLPRLWHFRRLRGGSFGESPRTHDPFETRHSPVHAAQSWGLLNSGASSSIFSAAASAVHLVLPARPAQRGRSVSSCGTCVTCDAEARGPLWVCV